VTLSPTILDRIHDQFVTILQHTEAIKSLIDRGLYVRAKAYIDRQKKSCEKGMAMLVPLIKQEEK